MTLNKDYKKSFIKLAYENNITYNDIWNESKLIFAFYNRQNAFVFQQYIKNGFITKEELPVRIINDISNHKQQS